MPPQVRLTYKHIAQTVAFTLSVHERWNAKIRTRARSETVMTFLLEIMHWARNLQISHLLADK